ncbi:MAG: ribonuclease P protein component [Acidimicrobiales bacterium]
MTRISDRTTHQRFRTEAIRTRHDWLGISYLPPEQPGHYRVAYALTRGAGSAVTRNRLRRQLAPLLEVRAADNSFLPGDYLMKIRRPVSASSDEIAVVLDQALAKVAARWDSAS